MADVEGIQLEPDEPAHWLSALHFRPIPSNASTAFHLRKNSLFAYRILYYVCHDNINIQISAAEERWKVEMMWNDVGVVTIITSSPCCGCQSWDTG